MGEIRWNQSNFSAGQFDPRAFARDDIQKYFQGAKRISNCVVLPQGGVQTRWGSDYVDTLTTTNPLNVEMSTLIYDDSAIYLLVWEATTLKIYLEDILLATVVTPYAAEDIATLYFCQVQNRVIVANPNFNPYQLTRSANANNAITAINTPAKTFTFTTPLTANAVYPVQFTGTPLMTTSPQIFAGRYYFIRTLTTTTAQIYSDPTDAYNETNPYAITGLGSSGNVVVYNTWDFSAINFVTIPVFDFSYQEAYKSATFTLRFVNPGDQTVLGTTIYIDAGAYNASMTSAYIGGELSIAGYLLQIDTAYSAIGPVLATGVIIANANPVETAVTPLQVIVAAPGKDVYLAQPIWSNDLGWPRAVTYFQGRLVFAGTASLNHGVWLSAINELYNFQTSGQGLDDDAISYYAASGNGSFIRSLTSARTLLVHTNTGTYSTNTDSTTPLTPSNFYLIEQNKDGVSPIQPVFIDNQVIYIDRSGNNAKNLIYDIIQGAYLLNNISVLSSNCINNPVDITALTEPNFTDGAYVLFVNEDGSLGVFQTLIAQNMAAWSKATTTMSDGTSAPYVHIASSLNDCWVITQRTVNGATVLMIERLNFTIHTDCTKFYYNLNSATVTGLGYLEGETVYAMADGYLQQPLVVTGGQITLPQSAVNVSVGLNFTSSLTLLPIGGIPQTPANLYKPMHIRALYINYYNTIGGTVGNAQIQTEPLNVVLLNEPPVPESGVKLLKLMGGWNTMTYEINIEQTQPLPMTIIGVGYILEIP